LDKYSQDIRQVVVDLTRFMAMGLTIDGQELCEAYQEGLYHIRMNCYPPCPQPEQVMGITPLADNSESLSCLRGATHRDGRF
jgi:isopenicillin N synthase-like dioxygenase